jgi:hypothetical protein
MFGWLDKNDRRIVVGSTAAAILQGAAANLLGDFIKAVAPAVYSWWNAHVPATVSLSTTVFIALVGAILGYLIRSLISRRSPWGPHKKLMRIEPPSTTPFSPGEVVVTGKYTAPPPPGWKFAMFTRRDNRYYPKGRFKDNHDGTWTCPTFEPNPGETQIIAAQVADGVYLWINLYGYMGVTHKEWKGEEMTTLPDSIRVDETATITIGPKPTSAAK